MIGSFITLVTPSRPVGAADSARVPAQPPSEAPRGSEDLEPPQASASPARRDPQADAVAAWEAMRLGMLMRDQSADPQKAASWVISGRDEDLARTMEAGAEMDLSGLYSQF